MNPRVSFDLTKRSQKTASHRRVSVGPAWKAPKKVDPRAR